MVTRHDMNSSGALPFLALRSAPADAPAGEDVVQRLRLAEAQVISLRETVKLWGAEINRLLADGAALNEAIRQRDADIEDRDMVIMGLEAELRRLKPACDEAPRSALAVAHASGFGPVVPLPCGPHGYCMRKRG